jgi:hypothetical protein
MGTPTSDLRPNGDLPVQRRPRTGLHDSSNLCLPDDVMQFIPSADEYRDASREQAGMEGPGYGTKLGVYEPRIFRGMYIAGARNRGV